MEPKTIFRDGSHAAEGDAVGCVVEEGPRQTLRLPAVLPGDKSNAPLTAFAPRGTPVPFAPATILFTKTFAASFTEVCDIHKGKAVLRKAKTHFSFLLRLPTCVG